MSAWNGGSSSRRTNGSRSILPESPAQPGEVPQRFIDGCQSGQAVACLRAPEAGWPIPVFLAEVGGVAMRLSGRDLTRDFYGLDRVVSFVTDAFPWQEVEALATGLANLPGFPLRVLPTDRPRVDDPIELFDYEKMRKAAQNRADNEMANWEAIALAADRTTPTLCDGRLEPRLRSAKAADRFGLVIGLVKTHSANLLHPQGWRTLLNLKPGQRTPYFRITRTAKGEANDLPVATWFVKMTGGAEVMPNWAAVARGSPLDPVRAMAGALPLGIREPPFSMADRRALPPAQLRPDGRLARADRPGRGLLEKPVQPLRRAAKPVPAARRCDREHDLMTDAHDEFDDLDASSGIREATQRLGKVAAPPNRESTSELFYFWAERGRLVERTQIVTTSCMLGGRTVNFVGLVEEVYRQSRQTDMGEEVDRFDADSGMTPPFASAGFTYAKAMILRTEPVTHAPPTEESTVFLGGRLDAERGYGVDRISEENKLRLGLLRNGGTEFAGPAVIDLGYLLGENGGHLNVNGIAGLGAKSSFLLHVNYLLLREAAEQARKFPSVRDRLQVVPIIFNVKNYDLFFIDSWSKAWRTKEAEAAAEWRKFIGVDRPAPFAKVQFFAPQIKGEANPVNVGRTDNAVKPYSWSLSDIIEHRLFRFLFSEADIYDANFGGLVGEVEDWLTGGTPGTSRELRTTDDAPQTFDELLDWFRDNRDKMFMDFVAATKGKFLRRLKYIVQEGDGVLRRTEPEGNPLVMPKSGAEGPIVIDLFGIRLHPVAPAVRGRGRLPATGAESVREHDRRPAISRHAGRAEPVRPEGQLRPDHGANRAGGRRDAVAGRDPSRGPAAGEPGFAPSHRERRHPAVGRSGSLELSAEVWKFLEPATRSLAAQIQADEKLLVQPSFREPMLAKIPYPPWRLRRKTWTSLPRSATVPDGTTLAVPRKSRREADFA